MDLAHVFYLVGIIACVIVIFVAIFILVLVVVIYKKIQQLKMKAQDQVLNVIDSVSDKMKMVPMGSALFSMIWPLIRRRMKR